MNHNLTQSLRRVLLFGASRAGIEAAVELGGMMAVKLLGFVDNDPARQNAGCLGLPVYAPAAAPFLSADAVVVTSMYRRPILLDLSGRLPPSKIFLSLPDFLKRGLPPEATHQRRKAVSGDEPHRLARSICERARPAAADSPTGGGKESDVRFCTLVTPDFAPGAIALTRSVLACHPGARITLGLIGAQMAHGLSGVSAEDPRVEVLAVDGLLPDANALSADYTRLERCCALRPLFFSWLLNHRPEEKLIYLDADILVLSPLSSLVAALDVHPLALTPHRLSPAHSAERDRLFLRTGLFNGGIYALRQSREARRFLQWHSRALRQHGRDAVEEGMHLDQRWLDLAPVYFPETGTVRDAGYNVAYWNLDERPLTFSNERWLADGYPLACFHLSGYKRHRPAATLRHLQDPEAFLASAAGQPVLLLLEVYGALLDLCGEDCGEPPDRLPAGGHPAPCEEPSESRQLRRDHPEDTALHAILDAICGTSRAGFSTGDLASAAEPV